MIVMLIDVWDVQAIDALDDEPAIRIRVGTAIMCGCAKTANLVGLGHRTQPS